MKHLRTLFIAVLVFSICSTLTASAAATNSACDKAATICLDKALTLPAALSNLEQPQIAEQAWMRPAAAPAVHTVSYNVETRGATHASLNEFKQLANETLNDSRGWSRMGVRFNEVSMGGDFTLVLAQPSYLATIPGCSSDYSCRSGQYVMINEDRWQGASLSWNAAGGNMRDYRHMVINHETGHWLGHGHERCGGVGQLAPVMQQQSIDLEGCSFNAWPLASELWSTTLGIAE